MASAVEAVEATAISETEVLQESGTHEAAVAALAYEFWLQRGCPIGSPEEDWFRAEQLLRGKAS